MKIVEIEETKNIITAVQITENNMREVADWCGRKFVHHRGYSSIEFGNYTNLEVADWVVKNEPGASDMFIPYTNSEFIMKYREKR